MKSNKGVAMMTLVIYVASFFTITALVGTISTYFYNNMEYVNTNVGGSSEYNKLNLYILSKIKDPELTEVRTGTSSIVFYYNNGQKEVIVLNGDMLYFNQIMLCSGVDKFKTKVVNENGKSKLVVVVGFDGKSFSTEYVVG